MIKKLYGVCCVAILGVSMMMLVGCGSTASNEPKPVIDEMKIFICDRRTDNIISEIAKGDIVNWSNVRNTKLVLSFVCTSPNHKKISRIILEGSYPIEVNCQKIQDPSSSTIKGYTYLDTNFDPPLSGKTYTIKATAVDEGNNCSAQQTFDFSVTY